jgi:hypothetical protein
MDPIEADEAVRWNDQASCAKYNREDKEENQELIALKALVEYLILKGKRRSKDNALRNTYGTYNGHKSSRLFKR